MLSESFTAVALIAITLAGPAFALDSRAGNVCSNGIYAELVPALKPYSVAQAFCTKVYPVKCTTQIVKRSTKPLSTTTSTKTTTSVTKSTLSTTKSTATIDAKASAWAKAQIQAGQVLSTLCSCIEAPPKACATTSKSSSTSSSASKSSSSSSSLVTSTPSSTSSTAAPVHTVNAPLCDPAYADDPNDFTNESGCSSQCTCQMSTSGVAYCGLLPDPNVESSCDADDECPQGEYCSSSSVQCVYSQDDQDACTSTYVPPNKRRLARSVEKP